MTNKIKIFFSLALGQLFLFSTTQAQNASKTINLLNLAAGENYDQTLKDPVPLIARIIPIILSFLGVIFLVLTIVSGFQWMTAGGNADVIKKSKARLTNAIIGLAIILGAYAITYYISSLLWDVGTVQ